jgi:hypothetical protein
METSNLSEAVARYRQAINTLRECRDLGRAKGLDAYGFSLNQTDALPIERLAMCLVKMRRVDEAAAELDRFVESVSPRQGHEADSDIKRTD